TRERALLGWAGLRGAVPIVLGTIFLSSGIGSGKTILNAVFFVVVVSALAQGTTLERVAELLGLASPKTAAEATAKADREALDLVDFDVTSDHAIAGSRVRELGLPRRTVIAAVVRSNETIEPTAGTRVAAGDRLVVMGPLVLRADLEGVFARWGPPLLLSPTTTARAASRARRRRPPASRCRSSASGRGSGTPSRR